MGTKARELMRMRTYLLASLAFAVLVLVPHAQESGSRMRSAQLEAYVSRLVPELKTRGLEDARLVEEAREHLVNAIEDGRRRGLSIEAAAHEAFDRFGAPEVLAAYIVTEREEAA